MQDNDSLNGAGGADTLNARTSDTTLDAIISNIETLNIEAVGNTTLDGALITGATKVNVTGGATLTYKAEAGEEFSVNEASTGLTVTRTATDTAADAIKVTLGAGKLGTVTLGDKNTTDYETVNLVVAGNGSATLTEADSGNNAESFADSGDKIVVTGSGDYTVAIAGALLGAHGTDGSEVAASIDAVAHTGKLTVDLGTLGATEFFSAEKLTGVDAIALGLGSTDADTLRKVQSGSEIIVNNTEAVDNTLTISPSGTATNDTLTVTLNDKDAGEKIDITGLTVDGFETVTIKSTGTDSSSTVVANVIDDVAGTTTDTTLIISGDKKLTATGIEATFTNITVTNTTGVDLTVDAGGALKFTGGAASDRLELDTVADLTSADALDGGAGKDTIAFSAIPASLSAAQLGALSNFEVVEFRAANTLTAAVSLDLSTKAGLNEVLFNGDLVVDDGATNTYTMTVKGVDGLTVNTGVVTNTATGGTGVMAFILDVKDAANAGTNNTVNVNLLDAGAGDIVNAGFVIDNVENLNIKLTGDGDADGADKTTITLIDGAQLSSIVVSSTNTGVSSGVIKASDDLVITAVETTILANFDASASTGKVDMRDISAFAAGGATIKGGTDDDLLTAGVGADVMSGGKGGDTLNGDQGNDSIDGGDGADNINGDVGADILTGGAGKDVFVADYQESTEAAMDKITDFKALAADQDYDKLDLTGTTVTSLVIGSAIDITSLTSETESGTLTAYSTDGIIKLAGTEAANVNTLAEWIDVAEALIANVDVTIGGTDYQTLAFAFNGNTYVVQGKTVDAANTETVTTGAVVELTGLTGITALAGAAGTNNIWIA